jgi:hypothetical protein
LSERGRGCVVSFQFPSPSTPPSIGQRHFHTSHIIRAASLALYKLENTCCNYLPHGLAANSRRILFRRSASVLALRDVVPLALSVFQPILEYQLMMFASWLARSLPPATVRIYIAAVRSLHIDLGFYLSNSRRSSFASRNKRNSAC